MEPRRYQVVPQEPNKRRSPRIRFSDAVQLHSEEYLPQGGLSCDISRGGLRLKTNKFFPLSSNIRVSLRLDSEKMLICKGQVMWISRVPFAEDEQYNIGVAFDAKSLADNPQDLRDFLNWKLSQS